MQQYVNFGFFLALIPWLVVGCPDGAPPMQCDSMTPNHGNNTAQNSTAPYVISVSNTSVKIGENITVTLTANPGGYFGGFLLKATPVGSDIEAVGSFFVPDMADYHTLNCSGVIDSTITHNNPENKTSISATWIAPNTQKEVTFRATVVESYAVFWLDLVSQDIVKVYQ